MKKGNFLSSTDLAIRWGVKRQTVNSRRIRHADFPQPAFRIGRNRAPLYDVRDIEKYEYHRGFKKKGADEDGSEIPQSAAGTNHE